MNQEIVLLSDEIKEILKERAGDGEFFEPSTNTNPEGTDVPMDKWCNPHGEFSLCVDRENGTRELVFPNTLEFGSVLNSSSWPRDEELVKFGLFCGFEFWRIFHFVVKSAFEQFLRDQFSEQQQWVFQEAIRDEGFRRARCHLFRFNGADNRLEKLHDYLALWKQLPEGLNIATLETLIHFYLISDLHMFHWKSREYKVFVETESSKLDLINQGGPEAQKLLRLETEFIQAEKEVAQNLYELTRLRIMIERVNQEFFSHFGRLYVPLKELELETRSLSRKIAIKQANPKLPKERVEELDQEAVELDRKKMTRLKQNVAWASLPSLLGSEESKESNSNMLRYISKMKKIFRDLVRLTHEDKLRNEPRLSDKQKTKLKEIYLEAGRIGEIKSKQGLFVIIEDLKDLLDTAKDIYESAGLNSRYTRNEMGLNIEERAAKLEDKIKHLELKSKQIMSQYFLENENEVFQQRSECLKDKEAIAETQTRFSATIAELDASLQLLRQTYRELFPAEN